MDLKFVVICGIVGWISVEGSPVCQRNVAPEILVKVDGHHCKGAGCLVSISLGNSPGLKKDPQCEYWLTLNTARVNKIRPNTFKDLPIDGLRIEGNFVLFDKRSLTGLPVLKHLIVRSSPAFISTEPEREVFADVSRVTHLEYPFYTEESIRQILPIFTKLINLTITTGLVEITNQTFLNAPSSIRYLEFVSPVLKLQNNAFFQLNQLSELVFTDARIKFLGPDVFKGLNSLRVLKISFSDYRSALLIPQHVFHSLKDLTNLTLEGAGRNANFSFSDEAFSGLVVKNLDLTRVNLPEVTPGLFRGLNAENMKIRVNDLDILQYQSFSQVRVLNLYLVSETRLAAEPLLLALWGIPTTTSVLFIKG